MTEAMEGKEQSCSRYTATAWALWTVQLGAVYVLVISEENVP